METSKQAFLSRRDKIVLGLAGLLVFANLGLFISRGLCDLSGDSARYLLLGKALARGQGYVDPEKPGLPAETEYGPGLPVLLAPILRAWPSAVLAGKMIPALSLIAAIVLLYLLALQTGTVALPRSAAFLVMIFVTMPGPYRFANQVLSDLPYTAASLLALVLVYRALGRGDRAGRAWVAAGLVMAAAFLFRQAGIALWIGAVAGVALGNDLPRGRGRAVILLSLGFWALAGAWLVRNYLAAGSLDPMHAAKFFMARDADPFAGGIGIFGLMLRTLYGFGDYFRESATVLLDMASPLVPGPLRLTVSLVASAVVLYGWGRGFLRRRGPLEFYFMVYLVIICAWQSHNPRYLLPVVPVALLFAASGIQDAPGSGKWRARLAWAAFAVAVVFNCSVLIGDLALIRRSPQTPRRRPGSGAFASAQGRLIYDLAGPIKWGYWYQYPDWLSSGHPEAIAAGYHRLIAASAWMGRNLSESALIMARKPRLVAYYSERSTIQYLPRPMPEAFLRGLAAKGVTHLLVDEASPEVRLLLRPLLIEHPGEFTPVFSMGRTYVLQFSPAGP